MISTHTPLAGRDFNIFSPRQSAIHFNSHAPCGARRSRGNTMAATGPFQLTRPLRGATMIRLKWLRVCSISTHTPLAGRDSFRRINKNAFCISTHTPLAGRDGNEIGLGFPKLISTHTPLAGRDLKPHQEQLLLKISTHTPLAGRDREDCSLYPHQAISTHTPLAGRDDSDGDGEIDSEDFNSHAPCGARRLKSRTTSLRFRFQLTRPLRGATRELGLSGESLAISTHTPLAGRDE